MKTKNKYFIIFGVTLFFIIGLFYMSNLVSENITYKESEINENKLEEKSNNKSELSILFIGDIMTDRYIRKQINRYKNIENFINEYLNNLSEINNNYDYVVANLEGPITENKSKTLNDDGTYGKDLIFTFPASTTQILKLLNVKVVSLANNHTDNFYNKGYQDTKSFLEKENISYFGNPYNQEENISKIICEKNICIAYIGYNQFTKENSPKIIIKEIEKIKTNKLVDFIIVFPHFGEEYEKISNKTQKEYARSWIDTGADLVVGAHPHVIQESEIYKGKYIYYSLGNYIFDQWFSKDVQNGLGLDIIFKKECGKDKNNLENKKGICKKEIILNKELKVFIDRNGVRYVL